VLFAELEVLVGLDYATFTTHLLLDILLIFGILFISRKLVLGELFWRTIIAWSPSFISITSISYSNYVATFVCLCTLACCIHWRLFCYALSNLLALVISGICFLHIKFFLIGLVLLSGYKSRYLIIS